MPVPNQVESLVLDELHDLLAGLQNEVSNPETRQALIDMARDAALIPVRISRGENVDALIRALSAEAQNRALAHRLRVEEIVREAWKRAIGRLLVTVLSAAL